ncbi:MAG: PAS domain-containing protein, partial [Fibrobacterota bacterium]|nr:PAS domain-containing protein [Fibrobacterota bacterium]
MPEFGPPTRITISQDSIGSVVEYAIFLIDKKGIIASWNEGAARMKQYRPEEIIGKPFATLFSEDDAATGQPQKEMDQAAQEGRYEGNCRRRKKDGSIFEAHVVLTRIQ